MEVGTSIPFGSHPTCEFGLIDGTVGGIGPVEKRYAIRSVRKRKDKDLRSSIQRVESGRTAVVARGIW